MVMGGRLQGFSLLSINHTLAGGFAIRALTSVSKRSPVFNTAPRFRRINLVISKQWIN